MTLRIRIEEASGLAITDLGRYGHAHLGVQIGGAADPFSARAANILVGNPDNAPLLEAVAIRPIEFTTLDTALLAVSGAAGVVTSDGSPIPDHTPFRTWPGARIRLEPAVHGLHAYIAVHGRIRARSFLGSVAYDPVIGVGTILDPGSVLEADDADSPESPFLPLFAPSWRREKAPGHRILRVIAGPEHDEFPDLARWMREAEFVVGQRSDRIGVRLEGPRPQRTISTEILSRGVPMGAVEVPPEGEVIALGRSRPLTAGYPVPLLVVRSDHHLLGQLRPGDAVRLRPIDLAAAVDALREQERRLQDLRERCTAMYDACTRAFGGVPRHRPRAASGTQRVSSAEA